jgi:deoxyribonuclease IV
MPSLPPLGAHKSIAGGYAKAVERAKACGCDCVQIFTASPRSFRGKRRRAATGITIEQAEQFQTALRTFGISHPIAHDGYLINLASPDRRLWRASVDELVAELQRAETLGIPLVVAHPGAHTTSSEKTGLRKVARALDEIHAQARGLKVRCLLETTAGQGSSLGWRFEQFATILDHLREPDRVGFCFDTCHVFAAGYPLSPAEDYQATMAVFDRLLGTGRIQAFHLNDSQRPLGSRIDRHAHIGQGRLGLTAFRLLLSDPRFQAVPMYLETPKSDESVKDWDAVNLRTLRDLRAGRAAQGPVSFSS